jgi:hypothetical protein
MDLVDWGGVMAAGSITQQLAPEGDPIVVISR